MRLNEFIAIMEEIAPPGLAQEGDNVGLLVGREDNEIRRVLVALDCTPEVAQEAVEGGFDLVLAHHPLFYHPQRSMLPDAPDTRAACILLRSGVALYAAHTNLDAAAGGVNDVLAGLLGLTDVSPLPPVGLGRIGTLPIPMPLRDFALLAERKLEAAALVAGDVGMQIARVAIVGGAGGDSVADAAAAGAQALLTGEARHHEGLLARQLGVALIAAGHYETENPVCRALIESLQRRETGIEYTLAQRAGRCLVPAHELG